MQGAEIQKWIKQTTEKNQNKQKRKRDYPGSSVVMTQNF